MIQNLKNFKVKIDIMLSISQLVVILIVVLVLFGAGKLPNVMGDIGKGIKNFRKNIKDDKNSDKQELEEKRSENVDKNE